MGAEHHPANEDTPQVEGGEGKPDAGRCPPVNKDDSIDVTGEGRSFGSDIETSASPTPRQGAGAGEAGLQQAGLEDRPESDNPEGRR